MASIIQSLSFTRASSSKLPVEISFQVSGVKKGSGLQRARPLETIACGVAVMSSNSAGTPALAKCAAICAPIVPAPKTVTLRITISSILLERVLWSVGLISLSTNHRPETSNERVTPAFEILAALSFCHLLNDMMQSLIPAIYPILKQNFQLNFAQIGLITFVCS